MRYAVVNDTTKIVTNVIVLDEDGDWTLPEGHKIVKSEQARKRDTYSNRKFIRPEPVIVPDPDEAPFTEAERKLLRALLARS